MYHSFFFCFFYISLFTFFNTARALSVGVEGRGSYSYLTTEYKDENLTGFGYVLGVPITLPLTPLFSLAAVPEFQGALLSSKIDPGDGSTLNIQMNIMAVGGHAGVILTPMPKVSIGIMGGGGYNLSTSAAVSISATGALASLGSVNSTIDFTGFSYNGFLSVAYEPIPNIKVGGFGTFGKFSLTPKASSDGTTQTDSTTKENVFYTGGLTVSYHYPFTKSPEQPSSRKGTSSGTYKDNKHKSTPPGKAVSPTHPSKNPTKLK